MCSRSRRQDRPPAPPRSGSEGIGRVSPADGLPLLLPERGQSARQRRHGKEPQRVASSARRSMSSAGRGVRCPCQDPPRDDRARTAMEAGGPSGMVATPIVSLRLQFYPIQASRLQASRLSPPRCSAADRDGPPRPLVDGRMTGDSRRWTGSGGSALISAAGGHADSSGQRVDRGRVALKPPAAIGCSP
jgi:hypothetical protein